MVLERVVHSGATLAFPGHGRDPATPWVEQLWNAGMISGQRIGPGHGARDATNAFLNF